MDATAWNERYAGSELVWTAEPNRFVVEEVAGLKPRTAVDLACGEGRNAVWLARQGWTCTGVDFSEAGLDKARVLAGETAVVWEQEDVLTWEGSSYDLVLLAYLHLPSPQRRSVLDAAARAVAPGGSLLVVGHDLRNLAAGVGGPQDPDLLWSPGDVTADGFTDRRRETAVRPTPGGDALDTVVHLVRA